ncbi:hypothetical protein SAMN05421881_103312 [Nitrosomonas halophila]|uniref:Uncharacterized protein n=1 Tax=Nitrosomonas halophila TaxID=44576 RepID=A0A1H3JIX7_9PROT|nr:hypothetical protein SAMN05421881_103312 [Nitrosomonas halophila]
MISGRFVRSRSVSDSFLAQQNQFRHGVHCGPNDRILAKFTGDPLGCRQFETQREKACFRRPYATEVDTLAWIDKAAVLGQSFLQALVGQLVLGRGQDLAAWVAGRDVQCIPTTPLPQECGKRGAMLADQQDDAAAGFDPDVVMRDRIVKNQFGRQVGLLYTAIL